MNFTQKLLSKRVENGRQNSAELIGWFSVFRCLRLIRTKNRLLIDCFTWHCWIVSGESTLMLLQDVHGFQNLLKIKITRQHLLCYFSVSRWLPSGAFSATIVELSRFRHG